MAGIVNLNKARKARGRVEAARTAEQNRVRFGRSKAEKALAKAEEELRVRRLDALRREPDPAKGD
jgi:vacuolar-type H+-ATPase subunit H